MSTTLLWFRRDLRLADHPALQAAARDARVVPLFVLDPRLERTGPTRDRLLASLAALREQTGGTLVLRHGDPARVVTEIAAQVDATEVHVSAETTPFGGVSAHGMLSAGYISALLGTTLRAPAPSISPSRCAPAGRSARPTA